MTRPPESGGPEPGGPRPGGGPADAGPAEPRRLDLRSRTLLGLFLLALFYTLYLARSFVLPLVLALLFAVLLGPVVTWLHHRLRLPRGLGSLLVLAVLGGGLYYGFAALGQPAVDWFDRAPRSLSRLEDRLRPLKAPVEKVTEATEGIEKLTRVDEEGRPPREVEVRREPLIERLFDRARTVVAGAVMMFILLYFLLVSGDHFLRRLVHVMPTLAGKRKTVEVAQRVQGDLASYLATITAINLGLGVAEGVAMTLLGMPNPVLWGAMATLLNFIPYLGAVVGTAVVGLVAALSFEEGARWLLPPLVYFLLTAAEGYLVTPMVLGQRLRLNPVVILLGLLFWGWMWGIAGAFLAVPLLVALKIFSENLPQLERVNEFLGR